MADSALTPTTSNRILSSWSASVVQQINDEIQSGRVTQASALVLKLLAADIVDFGYASALSAIYAFPTTVLSVGRLFGLVKGAPQFTIRAEAYRVRCALAHLTEAAALMGVLPFSLAFPVAVVPLRDRLGIDYKSTPSASQPLPAPIRHVPRKVVKKPTPPPALPRRRQSPPPKPIVTRVPTPAPVIPKAVLVVPTLPSTPLVVAEEPPTITPTTTEMVAEKISTLRDSTINDAKIILSNKDPRFTAKAVSTFLTLVAAVGWLLGSGKKTPDDSNSGQTSSEQDNSIHIDKEEPIQQEPEPTSQTTTKPIRGFGEIPNEYKSIVRSPTCAITDQPTQPHVDQEESIQEEPEPTSQTTTKPIRGFGEIPDKYKSIFRSPTCVITDQPPQLHIDTEEPITNQSIPPKQFIPSTALVSVSGPLKEEPEYPRYPINKVRIWDWDTNKKTQLPIDLKLPMRDPSSAFVAYQYPSITDVEQMPVLEQSNDATALVLRSNLSKEFVHPADKWSDTYLKKTQLQLPWDKGFSSEDLSSALMVYTPPKVATHQQAGSDVILDGLPAYSFVENWSDSVAKINKSIGDRSFGLLLGYDTKPSEVSSNHSNNTFLTITPSSGFSNNGSQMSVFSQDSETPFGTVGSTSNQSPNVPKEVIPPSIISSTNVLSQAMDVAIVAVPMLLLGIVASSMLWRHIRNRLNKPSDTPSVGSDTSSPAVLSSISTSKATPLVTDSVPALTSSTASLDVSQSPANNASSSRPRLPEALASQLLAAVAEREARRNTPPAPSNNASTPVIPDTSSSLPASSILEPSPSDEHLLPSSSYSTSSVERDGVDRSNESELSSQSSPLDEEDPQHDSVSSSVSSSSHDGAADALYPMRELGVPSKKVLKKMYRKNTLYYPFANLASSVVDWKTERTLKEIEGQAAKASAGQMGAGGQFVSQHQGATHYYPFARKMGKVVEGPRNDVDLSNTTSAPSQLVPSSTSDSDKASTQPSADPTPDETTFTPSQTSELDEQTSHDAIPPESTKSLVKSESDALSRPKQQVRFADSPGQGIAPSQAKNRLKKLPSIKAIGLVLGKTPPLLSSPISVNQEQADEQSTCGPVLLATPAAKPDQAKELSSSHVPSEFDKNSSEPASKAPPPSTSSLPSSERRGSTSRRPLPSQRAMKIAAAASKPEPTESSVKSAFDVVVQQQPKPQVPFDLSSEQGKAPSQSQNSLEKPPSKEAIGLVLEQTALPSSTPTALHQEQADEQSLNSTSPTTASKSDETDLLVSLASTDQKKRGRAFPSLKAMRMTSRVKGSGSEAGSV